MWLQQWTGMDADKSQTYVFSGAYDLDIRGTDWYRAAASNFDIDLKDTNWYPACNLKLRQWHQRQELLSCVQPQTTTLTSKIWTGIVHATSTTTSTSEIRTDILHATSNYDIDLKNKDWYPACNLKLRPWPWRYKLISCLQPQITTWVSKIRTGIVHATSNYDLDLKYTNWYRSCYLKLRDTDWYRAWNLELWPWPQRTDWYHACNFKLLHWHQNTNWYLACNTLSYCSGNLYFSTIR
jgi:hypothetical protein